uniref:Riboflavin biosynthesis protein n=1 Tax=uncultured Muribaculaceae bacterium TaxID=2301481 RepID=A0A6G8F3I3_9BACT|nr:riboflavin biosynthesis protein [uncultured Muribaculaceae bacterium]
MEKAAAIGTFDGVHRGHAAVLCTLKEAAAMRGLKPVAITFDRHPLSLIAPERAPLAITTLEKKEDLLLKAGVTPLVVKFDQKLKDTTASEWMRMMHDEFGVRHLVVGYDNTFGCDGVNLSIADYRRIGAENGITVEEAPVVEGISSSAVRKAIAAGEIEKANDMLGRRFLLSGIVVEGNQLGRTIGFPTANLMPDPGIQIPGTGVYAATAYLPDGSRHNAVVNIGTRPTVRRGDTLTIEAHIIGWHGNLYGMPLRIAFQCRLRPEMTFNSIQALREQIEKDTASAQLFLSKSQKQGN